MCSQTAATPEVQRVVLQGLFSHLWVFHPANQEKAGCFLNCEHNTRFSATLLITKQNKGDFLIITKWPQTRERKGKNLL